MENMYSATSIIRTSNIQTPQLSEHFGINADFNK